MWAIVDHRFNCLLLMYVIKSYSTLGLVCKWGHQCLCFTFVPLRPEQCLMGDKPQSLAVGWLYLLWRARTKRGGGFGVVDRCHWFSLFPAEHVPQIAKTRCICLIAFSPFCSLKGLRLLIRLAHHTWHSSQPQLSYLPTYNIVQIAFIGNKSAFTSAQHP